MNKSEIKALQGLKNKGYAIVVITPEELKSASPDKVKRRGKLLNA